MDLKRKKIILSDEMELLLTVRESILQTSQVSPLVASTEAEVMAITRLWQPDLLILGSEHLASTCNTLKSSTDFREIPLIAILRENTDQARDPVLAAGCDDWMASPLEEIGLLGKIQDLTGIRFRKLPRYTYQGPAVVSFKGKDFSSKSVDINRRMIFLESSEGLAPATGRNVRVRFQLNRDETIACWGRVIRLMAKRSPHEDKETIGMLIRFLDLPEHLERRIDLLAQRQAGNVRLVETRAAVPEAMEWLDMEFFAKLAQELLADNLHADLKKLHLPEPAAVAMVNALTTEEKATVSSKAESSALLKKSVAARFKVANELAKLRQGLPEHHAEQTLQELIPLRGEIQARVLQEIQAGPSEKILDWSKVKYEVLRSHLELQSILRGRSAFSANPEALASAKDPTRSPSRPGSRREVAFVLALIFLLILCLFLFRSRTTEQNLMSVNLGSLGAQAASLTGASLTKPGVGGWMIFQGNLNSTWLRMNAEEKRAYCQNLSQQLAGRQVRQIFLYGPTGELRAAVLNQQVTIFDDEKPAP